MKKSIKILSVFMALLLVVTSMPMTAFAAERDTSSLNAYLDKDNLAVVVDDLLTAVGDRKEEIIPTVLSICFQTIDALKRQAETDKIDPFTASTEELADSLINYLDEVLEDANLNDMIKDYKSIISMVLKGVAVDLNSVDGILTTLVGALDFFKDQGKSFCGDAASFDASPLKVGSGRKQETISTKNSSGLEIVNALFGFISAPDNVAIIKKVVKGELNLGSINATVKSLAKLDLEATVNDLLGDNLIVMINELLYENLLAEKDENGDVKVALENSTYAKFTCDELLAAALLKLITGKDATQAEAGKLAAMSLNDMIATYADTVIAKFAIEPLNNGLKDEIKKLISMDKQLEVLNTIIDMDYEFTTETFNLSASAQTGLFENLNNIVVSIAETLLQDKVVAELALKKGGNENITANLTSVFGYILKTLAANNGGKLEFTVNEVPYSFDFSGFTADKIAGKSLEDMVVAVVGLFYPTLLQMPLPAEVTSLEQLCGYTAYVCIDKFMVKDADIAFDNDYSALVLADGKVRDMSQAQWSEALGTMGMEVAIYWLNDSTNFGMTQKDVDALKAKGWGWEDFFEEIVDWALGYISGLPAVADELSIERGEKDGYGAWYKLNVVLNELLPLSFINDCADETFAFDLRTAVMDVIVPSLYDCDFAAFANLLAANDKEDNILNKGLINGVLELVDNLLFSLFVHESGDTANFEKAATATHDGYKGTYDKDNGHYIKVEVIPATGEKPTEPTTPPTTEPTTPPTTEPTTPPVGDVFTGDVDGNGKITAMDARLALRISAKLDEPTPEQLIAADFDGNGKVNAMDARNILRKAAGLV